MFRLLTFVTATVVVILLMTALVAQEPGNGKTVKLQGATNIAIEKIFEHITEITGRKFVVSPVIHDRSLKVPKDMEVDLQMLESLLKLNGITLQVVIRDGKTFYKAITDRELRILRYEAGKLYSEKDKLPEENVFVTVPFTVKYVDAVYIERTLTNRLVDRSGPGSVVSVGHNMLILKDFAPMVAGYIRIIREVDKPSDKEARVLELKNAIPDEIMDSLNKSTEAEKIKGVFPDNKNGRIIIAGEKAELDELEKVIKALDTETGERKLTIKLYKLENVGATEVARTINTLFTEKEQARGFVVSSAGSSDTLAVRVDNPMHKQLEKLIKALDTSDK